MEYDDYNIEDDIVEESVFRVGTRSFKSKQEAINYRETRLLEEFVNGIWGNPGKSKYYRSEPKTVNSLAKESGEHIAKLIHYVKLAMTKQDIPLPKGSLVNIELIDDDRIDQDLATDLFVEAVWRVMLGQKTVTRDSFKKKVAKSPDLFYKGLLDLAEIYAWKKLEED